MTRKLPSRATRDGEQAGCNDRLDATIGHIGIVSRHLGSLLGAIQLTVLCAVHFSSYPLLYP
jgi:hypothetical protein